MRVRRAPLACGGGKRWRDTDCPGIRGFARTARGRAHCHRSAYARRHPAHRRRLAHMHAAGAPWWGCPPTGCPEEARGIGRALTPWAPRGAASTWGAFFAEYRMMYYVRLLRDNGTFGPREAALLERVASRVAARCIRCGAAGTCTRIGHGMRATARRPMGGQRTLPSRLLRPYGRCAH